MTFHLLRVRTDPSICRPEYLRISVPSYYFGMVWERIVNRFEFLSSMRVLIVAVLQKPKLSADEE